MSPANPLWLPHNVDLPPRVLCPLAEPDHEGYYVKLSSAEDEYAWFKERMGDGKELWRRGHLVVARGGDGVGKSALLYRCAHWLETQLNTGDKPKIRHTWLSENDFDDRGEAEHARRVAMKLFDLARRTLANDSVELLAPRFAELKELGRAENEPLRIGDVIDVHDFLGQVLTEKEDVCFMLMLPPALSLAEVRYYVRLARPGLIFFTELDELAADGDGDLYQAGEGVGDVGVLQLWLEDALSEEDIEEFIRDRLSWTRKRTTTFISLTPGIVQYFRDFVGEKLTIYQLQYFLAAVVEIALARHAEEVSYDDVDAFFSGGTGLP